jgi:hypothetical protein
MAGTTNFVQVNPAAANQENDGTYAADPLTTGGVGVDDILPSPWLNKVWFQASTFICALAYVMANWGAGFNIVDTNLATLQAQILAFFQSLIGVPTCVRTDKTATYLSGTTYTNGSSSAVYEEVTLTATGSGTGDEFILSSIIDGATGPTQWITNDGRGACAIGFWVPPGKTFSATAVQHSGGTQPFGISQWTEVSF